jgi:hypothetical protein
MTWQRACPMTYSKILTLNSVGRLKSTVFALWDVMVGTVL